MASYTEIVKFESEAPSNTIRLIKSGEFYRAYNHSAWLFQCCIAEHKVVRKYVKALKSDIFYIGFPEKSLFGNIGDRLSTKTEHGFDITLSPEEVPDEDGYVTWCETVDTYASSRGDFLALPPAGADAERQVIRLIREFHMESKSMVECVVFLAELRKLLS